MLSAELRRAAHTVGDDASDYDGLLDRIGDARFVLLGESSHGTHQFYLERARITARLIAEKGFNGVAVEADWPDALRVGRFVRGLGDDRDAVEALADFERFPTWMWRNTDVVTLVRWMREWNERHAGRVGFYGLDLYSLHRSMEAVITWLDRKDPELAARARARYSCFDRFGDDPARYGRQASWGLDSCEDEVVEQLAALERPGQPPADEEAFWAEQNARVARSAEAYYRTMFAGRHSSWNLRDEHMADTLSALADHLAARDGRPAKVVVWAHNSHLGDARATEMKTWGELNLGQLCRVRAPRDTFIVGFTTYSGTVTAAKAWGDAPTRMRVRPGRPDAWESELHAVGHERYWLDMHDARIREALLEERLQRFIGVVYMPESERHSHYFGTRLAEQYDAAVHFDVTHAVEPLDATTGWEAGEFPETFPTSL